MQVLIIKTSSMGDIIHTLPALTDSLHAIPTINFHWVVEENFIQIPYWHPAVTRVIPVAIRRWKKVWFYNIKIYKEWRTFKHAIRLREYDAIIDAQGLIKSAALITRLAKGLKHGADWHSSKESVASLWYDKRHQINTQQHAVQYIRELFSKSLGYKLPTTTGDYAIAKKFFSKKFYYTRQYLVFIHSTTCNKKHWPEKYWHELIIAMKYLKFTIKLLWAQADEYQRSLRLAKCSSSVAVLPKLTLEQVAQEIANARLVVSVDTGLSHLTAALDIPNITLYGPTDPKLIGVYGKNQLILCPIDSKKMEKISVIEVWRAIMKVLL